MKPFCPILLLLVCTLTAGPARAQDAPQDDQGEPSASQETDINEENYRRFMELRDQSRQRASAPYAVLAPPSKLEKMDKLPEESQKHLRNQLLGIILEGERWSPEEAQKPYPFVPSEAAASDALLRGMEADAWAELVDNYHARESEIYRAGERARSATMSEGEGSSPDGEGSGAATKLQAPPAAAGSAAAGMPGSSGGSPAQQAPSRQAGETLSALHFLTGGTHSGQGRPESDPGATGTAQTGYPASADQMGGDQGSDDQGAGDLSAGDLSAGNEGAYDGSAGSRSAAHQSAGDPSPAQGSGEAETAMTQGAQEQTPGADSAEQNAASSPATPSAIQDAQDPAQASNTASASAQESSEASQSPAQENETSTPEVDYRSRGVIAISDLDKVRGTASDDEGKKDRAEDKDQGS